jgi:spermidine/putrescine ABC transporter ATP-binding subunit
VSQASVEVMAVSRRFGDVAAVDGVSLSIERGKLFSLLGPSGCGKTTLLRLIAGLEQPTAGAIRVGGADMAGVPPHKRPVNMVFQQYSLFPHLTVADNVGFGLRYHQVPRQARAARVGEALDLVRLQGLGGRYPHQLSGGQRQRVALARALVLRPQVLLLDEPLGALDKKLREEMQIELKSLQRAVGITFVFVTHDQEEALALSDTIAVMNRGRIEQVGTPAQVFEAPETVFVADFMGAANFWAAEVLRRDGGGRVAVRLECGLALQVPAPPAPGVTWAAGEKVRLVVRPEKIALRPARPTASGAAGPADADNAADGADTARPGAGSDAEAVVPVTVEERVYQGASTQWRVRDAIGGRFVVSEPNGASCRDSSAFRPGSAACLCWDPRHAVLLRELPLAAGASSSASATSVPPAASSGDDDPRGISSA